ncbi:MAG: DEAD/DEAH box helicase family protein, partial [Acidobacteria bacterium Pan2503]|nr:DEAD/DEAH box helicase family protein [Candidatus Acidoferrum panamensis]
MSVSTSLSPVSPAWHHQVQATEFTLRCWRNNLFGVLLAMWMGLGKTKVAIDLIEMLNLQAVLVVCPRPVVEVWR